MKHFKGKVKSIPVTEVKEGMQVIVHDIFRYGYVLGKVLGPAYKSSTSSWIIQIIGSQNEHQMSILDLKTLIVEYDNLLYPMVQNNNKNQLHHNYTQWQSTIDSGVIDSDQTVEFEIKQGYINPGKTRDRFEYAKIILNSKIEV